MSQLCIEDYAIGWICALQEEYEAACCRLDDEFEGPETSDVDNSNTYLFGRIDMIRSFPSLEFALMVGIGGGAPTPTRDIRLGDVVVSRPQGKLGGVMQYDIEKWLPDGRFQQTGQLNSPPEVLLEAILMIQRRHIDPGKPDRIPEHLGLIDDISNHQLPAEDRLYRTDYKHKGGVTCAGCGTDGLKERLPRTTQRAFNNAKERDQLAPDPELNVLCFEKEAAGLMNNFPGLVIRGICDYADSHNNDDWHKFAVLAAAAYVRQLLHVLEPTKVTRLPT
ncbi:nucleoside phosphorylase domain-containing protein [Dactylonectria macrodidyma]|uniref:Nucleoside phosphorylase domain-containing protein n=1 Tax=Dactylonectria macrodidyma TaxID=307937 RepID=A0A9P9E278_9HYPO|nr:nucleoside phosphorylase domain-containing protein [Dactylonectria macrodidyma]